MCYSRPDTRAFSVLCSIVAWPQLSVCNPGCQEVAPVSAAFVTLLSTVVPQRLFLILIYGSSILDGERGSMVLVAAVVEGWGGGAVQETIDKTVVDRGRKLAG